MELKKLIMNKGTVYIFLYRILQTNVLNVASIQNILGCIHLYILLRYFSTVYFLYLLFFYLFGVYLFSKLDYMFISKLWRLLSSLLHFYFKENEKTVISYEAIPYSFI